jgi:hypothetical protein
VASNASTVHSPEMRDVHAPAFDVNAPTLPQEQTFYAVDYADRDEEEFDELGEGAIRQIGRSFMSLVGAGSAASLVAALVMWSVPGPQAPGIDVAADTTTPISQVASLGNELGAGKEFFVDESASDLRNTPDEVAQFIEIEVNLPVPSVIEEALDGSSAPVSTIVDASGYPGPVPMPREMAYVAMAAFEESPLAQGSDDEALTAGKSLQNTKEWVSVMMPKPRPVF